MLLMGAKEFDVELGESFMVGDRWRDIAAGMAVGCKTLFIDYGYNEQQPEQVDYLVGSLKEAVDIILGVEK
jgi:D-glycero-D-manno-heptose 1,7-bisphosphate phosphatase